MTTITQCSRCDDVAECLDQGLTTLEGVADVFGCPTPSMHVHLVQHGRDDLLARLSYGGEPIIPKVEETTVVMPAPVEDVVYAEIIDEDTGQPVDPADWPEDAPQVATDAGLVEKAAPTYSIEFPTDGDMVWLNDLAEYHPAEPVRGAARILIDTLMSFITEAQERRRLEELVAQRDALNAQIEELATRLGDFEPASQPEPAALRRSEKPVRHLSAQDLGVVDDESPKAVRAWCRDNGVTVPDVGRVPRAAVEAFRAAHS